MAALDDAKRFLFHHPGMETSDPAELIRDLAKDLEEKQKQLIDTQKRLELAARQVLKLEGRIEKLWRKLYELAHNRQRFNAEGYNELHRSINGSE